MTGPTDPPEATPSARSIPGLALARARQPGANDHQQLPKRQQMLYAAAYAAQTLERAALELDDPTEALAAAEGLRLATIRLLAPRQPRRPANGLPRRGHLTGAGLDVSLEDLAGIAAVATAIAQTEGRR
jgi:hypothetical protein